MHRTLIQVDPCYQGIDRHVSGGNIFLKAAINTSQTYRVELRVYSELIEVRLVITKGSSSLTIQVPSLLTLHYKILDGSANMASTDSSTLN